MPNIEIRPATAADIAAYYGKPCRDTIEAVMVMRGDAAVGVIGLKHEPGRRILFADAHPDLGTDVGSFAVRRAIVEMVRRGLRSKLPLFSVKEPDSDVLPRLGFERVRGDLYQCRS